MIENRISAETTKFGQGYLDAGSVKTGQFVMLDGVFAHTVSRTGDFAETGDMRFTLATSNNGPMISGYARIGMVDKLLYKKEDSDLTLDTIDSGAGVIVHFGGVYETDQYNATLDTLPTVGAELFLDTVGKLSTASLPAISTGTGLIIASGAMPVAIFLGKRVSFNSDYQATGYIMVSLLPRNKEFFR